MPWSKNDYPDSMNNLSKETRDKAIEIANALLRDGMEDGRAIAIATDKAREYVTGKKEQDVYEVKFEDDKWKLMRENGSKAIHSADTKDALLEEAKPYVNEKDAILNVYDQDGKLQDHLYDWD
ncbi:DUF2188 domain-containing protein [Paenisporosarcina cavernae]|uniref:DUF2188 domain-containing protein n=1 Tax=Paenisporosarcina cavernae TaxID=2320858 RepID=A0A385YXY4_9BACL|nr:DUF2188 domain-containing protein [Paenisporosarcina cavernae]AYC30468.1 DUF2188 domain-containing protein [Paenisporosarcina cavernae]